MSSCFVPGGRFGRTMCAYVKKVDSFYLLVTWILSTGRRRVRDGYCCDLKKVDSFYLLVTWILSTGRRRVRDGYCCDLMLRRKTTVMDTAVP